MRHLRVASADTPVCGPGRQIIQPNTTYILNRQCRVDDGVIDKLVLNLDNSYSGINLDLYEVLINGTPIDFYKLIVSNDTLKS